MIIKQQVSQFIERKQLFTLSDKIIVTLSGGSDSVALLHILLSLGYTCIAAHCNFQLRGEESERDEEFVRKLCTTLHVELHTTRFTTTQYATENHLSIEMAARDLRYQWFEHLKSELGANIIAVAHHKDDSIETMLINLIRGTGINGLLGIRPKNGDIARPLLCISRTDILTYLKEIRQDFVTDSTNLQDEFTRNKIRLNLLPLMQTINPSVKENLIETSNHLNECATIYNKGIEDGKERVMHHHNILIEELLKEPSPEALLFEILYPLGFNSVQTKEILLSLRRQSGRQFISKDWRVIKDRDLLLIEKNKIEEKDEMPFHLIKKECERTDKFVIPRDKDTACLDADKIKAPITLRKWQKGDVFIPFGMKGKRKVSDYLTDRKFSIIDKEQQWILCSAGQIAWVIGERIDNRFCIDKETKHIIILKKSTKIE